MKRAVLLLAVGMLACAPYGSEKWKDNWERDHRKVCDDLAASFCGQLIDIPIRRWGGPHMQKRFGDIWFVQWGWHPGSTWEFKTKLDGTIMRVAYVELLHDRRLVGCIECPQAGMREDGK